MSTMHDVKLSAFFLYMLHLLTATSASRLVLVQSLIRNGDRNALWFFPTDTTNLNESAWGLGELTPTGMAEQYQLGRFIKRRYSNFLSEKYSAKEIYARSTDTDMAIRSALACLAGMYPPVANQIWNASIPWIPIPVHSTPTSKDRVLWMDNKCKSAEYVHETKILKSYAYQKVVRDNADFMEFVRQKVGLPSISLFDFWRIYDTLYCLALHKDTQQWPSWVNDDVFQKVQKLFHMAYKFAYSLPEIQRYRGALLFNEIASRNMEKIASESSNIKPLKYYSYYVHGNTQAALLKNLKASDGSPPTFNQMLLFELHESDGAYFIELYKKNDTRTDELIPIRIPECGEPCLASKFFELSQKNVPADYDLECGNISPPYESSTITSTSTATTRGTNSRNTFAASMLTDTTVICILASVAMICFLLFICTLIQFCKLKKSQCVVGKIVD